MSCLDRNHREWKNMTVQQAPVRGLAGHVTKVDYDSTIATSGIVRIGSDVWRCHLLGPRASHAVPQLDERPDSEKNVFPFQRRKFSEVFAVEGLGVDLPLTATATHPLQLLQHLILTTSSRLLTDVFLALSSLWVSLQLSRLRKYFLKEVLFFVLHLAD
ncbi:hypothetical protein J6590_021181 [Homalodisca vitripennis]|nr:hypothetical protein J6590_021181 [Homalodisca vitripennis]